MNPGPPTPAPPLPPHLCCTDGDAWTKRWTKSTWKAKDDQAGEFKLTAGKWYGDEAEGKGIQTGADSKYFAYYAEMKKAFDNTKKDLVLQVRGVAHAAWAVVWGVS